MIASVIGSGVTAIKLYVDQVPFLGRARKYSELHSSFRAVTFTTGLLGYNICMLS